MLEKLVEDWMKEKGIGDVGEVGGGLDEGKWV